MATARVLNENFKTLDNQEMFALTTTGLLLKVVLASEEIIKRNPERIKFLDQGSKPSSPDTYLTFSVLIILTFRTIFGLKRKES